MNRARSCSCVRACVCVRVRACVCVYASGCYAAAFTRLSSQAAMNVKPTCVCGGAGRETPPPVRKYPYEPGTPLSKSIVPSPASIQNHPSFQKYESKRIVTKAVDLDDLAAYVRELRPRCAHDFKPMCYLLQSLMGHLLAREMMFFSSEIRDLKNQLLQMRDLLAGVGDPEGPSSPFVGRVTHVHMQVEFERHTS